MTGWYLRKHGKILVLVALAMILGALISVACGGDDEEEEATSVPAAQPTAAPTRVPAAPTPTAITAKPVEPQGKYGGTLTLAYRAKMAHFDIHQSATDNNLFPQGPKYNSLLMFTFESLGKEVGPDLAETWEVSDDSLTFKFNLREGVKFHDGATLTADDVVATYERIMWPPEDMLSMREYMFRDVETVEAIDPLTVQFKLKVPNVVFLKDVASGWNIIVRKQTLEDNNQNLRDVLEYPGTGAFKQGEYEVKEYFDLEKFEDYFMDPYPYVDKLHIVRIDAESQRMAAVLGGRADYAVSLGPGDYALAKDTRPDLFGIHTAHLNYTQMMFNVNRPPWDDPRMRQAVLLVTDAVGSNFSDRVWVCGYTGGWMPHQCLGGQWDRPESELRATPGFRVPTKDDIEEAKRLLAEAGFPDGLSGIEILTRSANTAEEFAYNQDRLRRHVGLDTTMNVADQSVYYDLAAKGDFDWALAGGGGQAFDDPNEIWDKVYLPNSAQNYGGIDDPALTALLNKMRSEFDPQARRAIVMETHLKLDELAPLIPWNWQGRQSVGYDYIKGIAKDPEVISAVYNAPSIRKWERAWLDK